MRVRNKIKMTYNFAIFIKNIIKQFSKKVNSIY